MNSLRERGVDILRHWINEPALAASSHRWLVIKRIEDRKATISPVLFDEQYRKECDEKRKLIWALVDAQKNFRMAGIKQAREQYGKEIQTRPEIHTVALEWKKFTNPSGWSWDVPKQP
jgi:hypothetical protein